MKKPNRGPIKLIVEHFRDRRLADDQPELCYTGLMMRDICRQMILGIFFTEDRYQPDLMLRTVLFCADVADAIRQGHGAD